ncbi:hypothetical protein ID866_13371 [Astraeus odoratus]|nr:hypothetical protein ID866_13371 [Astraeus odoratus]
MNAITHLSNATRCRPEDSGAVCTKVCEPDTFDSTDPKKLHEFLVQCELNFHNRPQAFCSDAQKVSFALSFLKGIALTWFKPNLLDTIPGTDPAWADNYSEFVIKLTTNFGPHNPVSDAKHQLDNLLMKDVHGYGEGALCHMFYNGLPDHINVTNQKLQAISKVGEGPEIMEESD